MNACDIGRSGCLKLAYIKELASAAWSRKRTRRELGISTQFFFKKITVVLFAGLGVRLVISL